MKHHFTTFARLAAACAVVAVLATSSFAQGQSGTQTTPPEEFKPSGKFSMQFFGDWYYMLNADTAAKPGKTYYVPVDPTNADKQSAINQRYYNSFDIRRVYLGYDYNFTKNASAQLLLSHESGNYLPIASTSTSTYDTTKRTVATSTTTFGAASGDIVLDGNRGLFIKAANVRFKNAIPYSTLIFGQQGTAAFAMAEQVWGYRSIEKTAADLRGLAQSSDLGIQLTGGIDNASTLGYSVMISNGNGAKAENDKYKKYALELNTKLLDNKLVLEVYGDYMDKATASSIKIGSGSTATTATNVEQSNTTIKALAGVLFDAVSGGVEYAMQTLKGQSALTAGQNASPSVLAIYARGYILPKELNWFARYDMYDPDTKASSSNVAGWKENFLTVGLDWMPTSDPNIHVMPNLWMDMYKDKSGSATDREGITVGRMTFFYKF